MAIRIAVASPIGGSGRTTLVLNLGLALCDRGLRVLMIDVDPQGGLGLLLARKDDEWYGLADFLMGRVTLEKAVKRSNAPLLSLLPRGRLDPGDVCEFEQSIRQPKVLQAGLRNLDRHFDVLLMDLPSGTGQIPRGALAVADEVLLTIRSDALAIRALNRMLQLVDLVREEENRDLRLTGILTTFVNERSTLAESVIRDMKRKGAPVLDGSIPDSDLFLRAAEIGQPVKRLAGNESVELRATNMLADLYATMVRDGETAGADGAAYSTEGRYQRFDSQRFREKLPILEHRDAPGGGPVLELEGLGTAPSFGAREWNGFLDACMKASGAETSFVMDGQGLTITSRGRLGHGQVSGLGTRLTIAFEQARRMEIAGGHVESVLVEFVHLWLTGLAFDSLGETRFTIGMLGREPVTPSMRKEIRGSLKALLNRHLARVTEEEEPVPESVEITAEPIF